MMRLSGRPKRSLARAARAKRRSKCIHVAPLYLILLLTFFGLPAALKSIVTVTLSTLFALQNVNVCLAGTQMLRTTSPARNKVRIFLGTQHSTDRIKKGLKKMRGKRDLEH
jgi:hypothetical protein